MKEMPILTMDLRYMREEIKCAMMVKSDEVTEMVNQSVDKTFSTLNIQHLIDVEVEKVIKECICDISNNYEMKKIFSNIVINHLNKKEGL
ncbi:MAG: hypothetical protein GQ540_03155 [Lutibacter sp.]|uniref:hypothetical protein n=1 Tax=Lutibacter sp. TaxID=1925666 RepID=UPI0019EF6AB2|nr:hypothetical protein [Lutibacter sp.]NOR27509.1 hypothetical protein [Lutibacter sp.]